MLYAWVYQTWLAPVHWLDQPVLIGRQEGTHPTMSRLCHLFLSTLWLPLELVSLWNGEWYLVLSDWWLRTFCWEPPCVHSMPVVLQGHLFHHRSNCMTLMRMLSLVEYLSCVCQTQPWKNNNKNFLAAEWPVLEMEKGGEGGHGGGGEGAWAAQEQKYMGKRARQVISSSQSSFLSPKERVSHLPLILLWSLPNFPSS